jgi:hypothetical protein
LALTDRLEARLHRKVQVVLEHQVLHKVQAETLALVVHTHQTEFAVLAMSAFDSLACSLCLRQTAFV